MQHYHRDRAGEHRAQLARYLTFLAARSSGRYIDLRWRSASDAMRQEFILAGELRALGLIEHLAQRCDVYTGVLTRTRRAGDRSACAPGRLLWADCDSRSAVRALRTFPTPSLAVASGGEGRLHAYWTLAEPLPPQRIGEINSRIAVALGADAGAVCNPAAILRPPGTRWHKASPPRAVTIVWERRTPWPLAEIEEALPEPEGRPDESVRVFPRQAGHDPLLAISPRAYVPALTGERVGPGGKLRCPLPGHEDRTPSFHAYREPEQGWHCFGCGRGGSVYDLGAALWGIPPRGESWHELRRRLAERLLGLGR